MRPSRKIHRGQKISPAPSKRPGCLRGTGGTTGGGTVAGGANVGVGGAADVGA